VLLLFDIDGTLLAGATDAHRDALHAALREVHGVDAEQVRWTLSPAGRTDGEIARAILLGAGIDARQIDERAHRVRARCCAVYSRLATADLSHTVLPGVPELLADLDGRPGVGLALVTGNYEPVARLKLQRAGLAGWFPLGQGAFGSDSEDRVGLPAIARRRAGHTGVPYPRSQTLVIGDTPRDIACARADELRCLGVATGPYSVDELSDADYVARDAVEARELLAELVTG
jgi:phosphoglycolate phosphatase-like HAD superfamily hydrolase